MNAPQGPPQPDRTALYVALGVGGGILLLCIAPALIIVVCLAAIQVLGTSSSTTFQTVGASIGTTVGNPLPPQDADQAEKAVNEFVLLLRAGKFDEAHASTSSDYRGRTSSQSLRTLWDGDPVLRQRNAVRYTLLRHLDRGNLTRQIFQVTWFDDTTARNTTSTIEVSRLPGGDWQVSRFALP